MPDVIAPVIAKILARHTAASGVAVFVDEAILRSLIQPVVRDAIAAALLEDRGNLFEVLAAKDAQIVALHAALTTEQQARDHDAVAADNALAEKTEWLRVREKQVSDAASVIEQLETELAYAREQADYFRVSRDKNGEALDAARVQLETLRAMLERCVGASVTLLPEA